MAGRAANEGSFDPGIRLVLEELRDMRVEMRADRQRADEERRKADEERRKADEERRKADEERRRNDAEREERWRRERQQSDERFEKLMREMQRAFRDIRSVGLSIVKTLNHHTRILERIERRLGGSSRWHPGRGDGRRGGTER